MESSSDEFQTESLDERSQRTVYLITYSQANLEKFSTREQFALRVKQEFESSSKISVLQWVCCRESHTTSDGVHYHLAVKLSAKKRWKSVKEKMQDEEGVVLHFSSKHDNYYTAYQYVTKSDTEFVVSDGHPDLSGAPRTSKCVRSHRTKRKSQVEESQTPCGSKSSRTPKAKRLSPLEVGVLICDREFRSPVELRKLAEEQRREGKTDLAEFCINRTNQRLEDLFESAWGLREASQVLEKKSRKRMDVIRQAATEPCEPDCGGRWLNMAREVLEKNKIHEVIFAHTLREALTKGRGKKLNVMIVGETNTAKSFILQPLAKVFDCFLNPAVDKYAWVGVNDKECILLQDFEFNKNLISWKSFLLLLEGTKLNLPAPKNHYSKDEVFESDIPVFATSGQRIVAYNRLNQVDAQETKMMDTRWKYIEFTHQFPVEEQIRISPCGACFSKLVLSGEL